MQQLDTLSARLLRQMQQHIENKHQQLESLQHRLLRFHPDTAMESLRQRLRFAQTRLLSIQQNFLKLQQSRFQAASDGLHYHNPQRQLPVLKLQLAHQQHALHEAMKMRLEQQQHRLSLQARSLDNLSPLKTLSRGFATISKQGAIITSAQQLASGDEVDLRLQDGAARARIL